MHQVSAQDAQFLYLESENNLTHVTSVSIYDPSSAPGGTVRFKDIIEHVASRQHTSPLFRRKLVHVPMELDYPYWVDDEYYDIEYHIRHGALPAPGDWRQFCIHLARYHSRPLDMNRPPWEMYVIEGLDAVAGLPKGCYAIATKIHHVAVDGASVVNFFAALSDRDAKGTPVVDLDSFKVDASERPRLLDMARRGWINNLRSPVRMADTVFRSTPVIYRAVRNALEKTDPSAEVPHTRFNGNVSPHKMFGATRFALADFKTVRTLAEGATLNDVVLAVCSGGLRRYLLSHDELPEEPLIAWVPINRRSAKDSAEAPGNDITAMTAPIYTDIADPILRLQAIVEATGNSKEARSGLSARLMTDITRHIPAATQVAAARLILSTGVATGACNLFISNVPGPQQPYYMNGAKIVENLGMAPLSQGMGLFIATPSYNGKINFSVTSTREIMSDIDFFIECLERAAAELKALARPTKKKTAAKGSKKK